MVKALKLSGFITKSSTKGKSNTHIDIIYGGMDMKIKRMDFVMDGDTIFLVTKGEGAKELELWDFKAWVDGCYDAYIPLSEYEGKLKIIGNFIEHPELFMKECEGYNGEPGAICKERIWTNKNLSGCADGSKPCCGSRNAVGADCPDKCSCHEAKGNLNGTDWTIPAT